MRFMPLIVLFVIAHASFASPDLTPEEQTFANYLLAKPRFKDLKWFVENSLRSYRTNSGVSKEPHTEDRFARTLLHECVAERDLAAVKELLTRGADLTKLNGSNQTAFHMAMDRRFWSGAIALLDHDANPNDIDTSNVLNKAPIVTAVENYVSILVAKMMGRGADPNTVCEGLPLLAHAIRNHDSPTALVLIEGGADVNDTSQFFAPPTQARSLPNLPFCSLLGYAVVGNMGEVVRQLLAKDAKQEAPIWNGSPELPFDYALQHGLTASVCAFLDSGKVGVNNDYKNSSGAQKMPLEVAARFNHFDLVLELLKRGAKPEPQWVEDAYQRSCNEKLPMDIARALLEALPTLMTRNYDADSSMSSQFIKLLPNESEFAKFVNAPERRYGQNLEYLKAIYALKVALSQGWVKQATALMTRLDELNLLNMEPLNQVLPYASVLANTEVLRLILKSLNFDDYESRVALRQALVNAICLGLNDAREILALEELQIAEDTRQKDALNVAFLRQHPHKPDIGRALVDAIREGQESVRAALWDHASDAERKMAIEYTRERAMVRIANRRTAPNATLLPATMGIAYDDDEQTEDSVLVAAIAASAAAMPAFEDPLSLAAPRSSAKNPLFSSQ